MREPGDDYRLYRVYEIEGRSAKMRVSQPMRDFADRVVTVFESLPDGVSADGISINPNGLSFEPEVTIELREDDT
jgi:hypothetical protein